MSNVPTSPLIRCSAVVLFLAGLFSVAPVRAQEPWTRVATKNFEMYTTDDAAHATAALEAFERVRSFFLQSDQATSVPPGQVKIVAFRSEAEYAQYRLNPGAFAYFLHNYKGDYIVMRDINPEHFPAVIHEYTHLVIQHSGWKLPLWMNEGVAEVYSSLQVQGNQMVLGKLPVGRMNDLRRGEMLSLPALMAVDHSSPYYQQRDKMRLFYAEAWALSHMLMLSPEYKSKLLEFVAAISAGKTGAECFEQIYGKTLEQVQGDLVASLNVAAQQTELLNVKAAGGDVQPVFSPLSNFDRDLTLADLLSASTRTAGVARTILLELSAEQPKNADVEESLGYLAWQRGDEREAQVHFRRAFQNGSDDPVMLCEYASLVEASEQGDIQEGDAARAALLKALAIRPDYTDARLQFALMEFRAGRYQAASTNFSQIKTVKPEQAYCFYSALAFTQFKLGRTEEARAAATSAQHFANSPQRQERCLSLLTQLDSSRRRPEALSSLLP